MTFLTSRTNMALYYSFARSPFSDLLDFAFFKECGPIKSQGFPLFLGVSILPRSSSCCSCCCYCCCSLASGSKFPFLYIVSLKSSRASSWLVLQDSSSFAPPNTFSPIELSIASYSRPPIAKTNSSQAGRR